MYATHKHMGLLLGWGGGGAAVLLPEISVHVLPKIAYINTRKYQSFCLNGGGCSPALYAYAAPLGYESIICSVLILPSYCGRLAPSLVKIFNKHWIM